MKAKTQHSLLKWASLLCNKQLTSIIDIENTSILIKLLNILQPLTFQQLYQIDQRSSNSVLSILKSIDKYFKRELKCNVSSMIENLNIFKSPLTVWQLLIGVAIKGRNRDANINVILQMELQQQSELMLLVEDVIQKLNQFEIKKTDNKSELSSSSDQFTKRDRNKSRFSNQIINEIVEQNQSLKQKVFELQSQISQQKSSHQKIKKNYQQRLNQLKSQRYQFLQALTGGSSGIQIAINRSRKSSQFNFRDSIHSSTQSKIFDDPLHDLNVSITGTLPQIATDMLNAVKNLKKQLALQQQKASLFEEHLKDLKLSLNPVLQQNKILKSELKKALELQKEFENLKSQNDQLLKNQTQMIKIISQVEEQKLYLRQMIEKLKQEKNQLALGFNKKTDQNNGTNGQGQKNVRNNLTGSNNMLDVNFTGSNQKIDIMRAPSIILRQMASEFQPQSSNLNEEIEKIKNPIIQQKYEKQLNQLREKNNYLRQQNSQLKQVNKMLQKTVHKSMEKSQEIQKNIEEGYKALFGIQNQIQQNRIQNVQQQPSSPIQISVSHKSNVWQENQNINGEEKQKEKETVKQTNQNEQNKQAVKVQKDNKIVEFYEQVKKIVESYEQKELLMMIQIESLKKQLNDLMIQKTKNVQDKQKDQNIKQSRKHVTFDLNNNIKINRQISIKQNVIQEKIQTLQKPQLKPNQNQLFTQDKKTEAKQQQKDNQEDGEKRESKRQDSVLMFNINISGPGGQISQSQNSQEYQVRKSQVIQKDSQIVLKQQKIQIKIKKDHHPSEEFIQIQEGQEFNQHYLPIRKSHQNSQNQEDKKESFVGDNQQEQHQERNIPGFLDIDYFQCQNRLSTVSGIGLRFSKDERRSFFARSGFYNESFLEVSNKIQAEIETDLNEITDQLKTHNKFDKIHQKYEDESFQQKKKDEQKIKEFERQDGELLLKLNRIKESYEKIRQFHVQSSDKIQSQLKQQLSIQKSQLTQLKIKNEQLKQSLTLMIAQKQSTKKKLQQMRNTLKTLKFNDNGDNLAHKFNEMLSEISQLQMIMPQLQHCLQESRIKQLQILYTKEKQLNTQLNQQIQVLLQTIVFFRNLAICDNQSSQDQ